MDQNHPRYREFSLAGLPGHADQGKLKIILFKRDEKLRSHALKHFANLAESEPSSLAMGGADLAMVIDCIARLKKLECPYYVLGTQFPPCERGRGQCRHFYPCGEITSDLEDAYLNVVAELIEKGGEVPRYAYFFSDRESNDIFCTMPDRPVVIKAFKLPDGVFNLVTCYSGPDIPFMELRDLEVEKMRNEARSRNISLYSSFKWGFDSEEEVPEQEMEQDAHDREELESRQKTRKRQRRYSRGGGGNWRKYLEEFDDQ